MLLFSVDIIDEYLYYLLIGEKFFQYQKFPVMAIGISADMQLIAHASNMDGTLRVCRVESPAQPRFVGVNLHAVHETLQRSGERKVQSVDDEDDNIATSKSIRIDETFAQCQKNEFIDINFHNVDSTGLMADISPDQLNVLSHMNQMMQPYLLDSNVMKMKRIVQLVHLVNRWTAHKRIRKGDVHSLVQMDPRWEIFSLKVAQWVYLCEYFPYRMSYLVHLYIQWRYNMINISEEHYPQGISNNIDESRLCDFYQQHVEPGLYGIGSAGALARLDGPPEVFRALLAATPSSPLADKMFATTFQKKFCSFTSASASACFSPSPHSPSTRGGGGMAAGEGGGGGAGSTAVDLSDITCKDLIASISSSSEEEEDDDDDFHFLLLECTFNLDPEVRNVISVELSEVMAKQQLQLGSAWRGSLSNIHN
jgi:hypothetical protein